MVYLEVKTFEKNILGTGNAIQLIKSIVFIIISANYILGAATTGITGVTVSGSLCLNPEPFTIPVLLSSPFTTNLIVKKH